MSQQQPLTMLEEYEAMFEDLGDCGAAFWKFFDMFRIQVEDDENAKRGVTFGKSAAWTKASDEQLRELRSYWKEQRRWIKKEGRAVKPAECRRRMWFWVEKVTSLSMFDSNTRREVYWWFDTCEERFSIVKG
jgi:hypothetical protein